MEEKRVKPARTLKRPRLVWTPQLHKRFVDAVAHLGIKNAVPKTIMQLMSVDGLTRENVASHLQKYRLYLKRMQGLSSSPASGAASAADTATEQLFASGPVPHHFLTGGPAPVHRATDPYTPFVPVAALQYHQHIGTQAMQQQQFYHQQRSLGQFGGLAVGNGGVGFDHGFLNRAVPPPSIHRIVGAPGVGLVQPASYSDDLEMGNQGGGSTRKELSLFPISER